MNEQRAHFSDLQLLELKNLWLTNSGEHCQTLPIILDTKDFLCKNYVGFCYCQDTTHNDLPPKKYSLII